MAKEGCLSMKRFLRTLCLALCVLALFPVSAVARSFSVERVDIDATVSSDGSLWVDEKRAYAFDGSFGGIYWDVPRGTYEGRAVEPEILSVSVKSGGQDMALVEGYDGEPGTYELSIEKDYYRLKLYWPAEDETVTFQVQYDLSELATRWQDVGELYWQYVPADGGSGDEWHNIACTVHLPIPDGAAAVVGEDVRAWGHGPLDGELSVEPDKVTLFSPGVGAAEYLETRIAFPAEWLSDASVSGEAHLDAIIAEEAEWAKDANSQRTKAHLTAYGFPAFMCLAGIGSAVASLFYRKRIASLGPKPTFTDTYYRDVPTNDHPAVLGMLYRDGQVKAADFSATLMRLTDQGRIILDAVEVEKEGKHGKTKRVHEWRLTRRTTVGERARDTRAGGKAIDNAAMKFLFETVAGKPQQEGNESALRSSGEPSVLMSDFEEVAEKWPTLYKKGYDRWDDAVRTAYKKRGFVAETGDDIVNAVLGLGCIALSIIFAIVGAFLRVPNGLLCVGLIVWFAAGLYIVWVDEGVATITFTQEAVDIRAKLKALKRWLEDFTRLEETIPTDVMLWNRLLVMATVFGIADKVVEQLKVHVPELMGSSHFWAANWYRDDVDDLLMPYDALGMSMDFARDAVASQLHHDLSTGDVAGSSYSSSSGGGGGFSSGGGGGFSGGGRGGAF